jgi:hypothetical protein
MMLIKDSAQKSHFPGYRSKNIIPYCAMGLKILSNPFILDYIIYFKKQFLLFIVQKDDGFSLCFL